MGYFDIDLFSWVPRLQDVPVARLRSQQSPVAAYIGPDEVLGQLDANGRPCDMGLCWYNTGFMIRRRAD